MLYERAAVDVDPVPRGAGGHLIVRPDSHRSPRIEFREKEIADVRRLVRVGRLAAPAPRARMSDEKGQQSSSGGVRA